MTEISSIPRRVEWIDVAKGIAIILVILVHSIIPQVNAVTTHLSSFAIPLFFVLAGLTYNSDRHKYQLKKFAIARGRQFLIPYFVLYTIIMGLFYLLPGAVDTYLTPDQLVFWFFYGSGPPDQATHLWFLPVLYFGFMLFVVLDRILSGSPRWCRFLLVPILPVIAFGINSLFIPMLVPWHLGAILMATTFALLGNEMRSTHGLKPWSTASKAKDAGLIILVAVSVIIISELNGFTDIAVDNLGINLWLYILAGTLGSILIFSIASQIALLLPSIRSALVNLGNIAQEVYEFHPLTFLLVPPILMILGWPNTDIENAFDSLWFVRFFLGIFISIIVVVYLIRKNSSLSFLFTGFRKKERK